MRIRLVPALLLFSVALLSACSSGDVTSSNTTSSSPPAGGGGTGTATLTWDGPATNADASTLADLAGYRVYQSTTSGSYTSGPVATIAAGSASGGGTATATISNLASGTYYFVVRAYDASGNESANSPERSKTIP